MPGLVSKRTGWVLAAGLATLAVLAWRLLAPGHPAGGPLNVLLVSIDTCRADHLGCYGDARGLTPHIDEVARDGVLFTRVHSSNPITLPAHSTMMTGTNPPLHGVRNNHSYRLAPVNRTLAEILREHGYRTAAFVSSVILEARFGLDQGFDVYDDSTAASGDGIDERGAEETSQAAIRWLEASDGQPFFLFLHYFDPHVPYAPPEPFASRDPDSPYAGEIAYVDHGLGQVLGKLESLGLHDSTIVLITSDHGESLGEHGEATHSFFVYDSTMRVPLVIRSPGGARSARVGEPAGIVDIVPTVLGLLGLPAPADLEGVDLSGWVTGRGRTAEGDRDLYGESLVPTEYGCSPLYGLVRGDWKLIWTRRPELYDLARDPGETRDRFAERPDLAGAMQASLQAMLHRQTRALGAGGTASPDARSLEKLRSLGYAGGAGSVQALPDEAAGEDPKDFIGVLDRLLRANALRSRGQLAEARRLCLEVLDERPGNLRALQILGDVALLQGDCEGAVRRYSSYLSGVEDAAGSVLEHDADLAEVHYNLGSCLHRLRRLDEAADHYGQALRFQADLAQAHNALGAVLAEQGRLAEAIPHFRRALAIDPTLQSARANLARATVAVDPPP